MANNLTGNPFIVDTKGIICNKPMHIVAVVYVPTAANNELKLQSWREDVAPTLALRGQTGTIATANTLTITNMFTAGAAGAIVRILESSGAAANIGRRQIESYTTDDAITIEEDNWTNEATKIYSLDIFTSKIAIYMKAGATDASPVIFNPAGGIDVPNLHLFSITAGTAYIYFTEGAYSSIT